MIRCWFALLCAGLCISWTVGQTRIEIMGVAGFVEVDNLENIYVATGSEVKRYNKHGVLELRYSNNMNGELTAVDVTNPMKVLLYYNESSRIVFLNQHFAPVSQTIDLYETTGFEPIMAGASSGGGFWIFSIDTQSLKLFNAQLVKVQESQNLSELLAGERINFIREFNQKVYMGMDTEVLVFDMFGVYLTRMHFEGATHIKLVGGQISYAKNESLWVFNLASKNEVEKKIPNNIQSESLFYFKKCIYVMETGRISKTKLD